MSRVVTCYNIFMPPRRFEYYTPEPEHRHRFDLNDEETKQAQSQQQPKLEQKKPEKKPEEAKKEAPKEEEKTNKKELPPEEKQERRTEAIERSHALKKQFEETPIPNDASTVARLIIAEQILTIGEQLQDPETFTGSRKKKELEATLDYMCDLAQKFEDPIVETPPHIQTAYETLMELTEEALHTAPTPEKVLEEITETLQLTPDEAVHVVPEFTSPPNSPQRLPGQVIQPPSIPKISPAVENLLTYLHLAIQPASINTPPGTSLKPLVSHVGIPSVAPTSNMTGQEFAISHTKSSRAIESPLARPKVHDAHEYHLAMQPNIAKPLAAIALASIVASAIHRTPEISHRHETTAPIPTSNHDSIQHPHTSKSDRQATQAPTPEKHTQNHFTSAAHETFASVHPRPAISEPLAHPQPNPESSPPSGKLEHLSLTSLLGLAQDVHVGHGRYLKAEFEHGRIDKDGLIKVLKAKKKGLDFSQEFNHQAANFRERLASIEFITRPPKPSTLVDNLSEHIANPAHEPSKPAAQKEVFTHPIFERYAHPKKSLFEPSLKNTIPVNFIVAIIIFGTLIVFLLIPA